MSRPLANVATFAAPEQSSTSGTVSKALRVLEAAAQEGRAVRFVELQNALPYPKSTLHRMLRTLVAENMLEFDEEQHTYRPGLRLVRLAHAAWADASLATTARDALDWLAEGLRETVHLGVLDNAQVLYVDKRTGDYRMSLYASVGKVGPAYCTGIGKAMLSALSGNDLENALSRQAFHRYTPQTITDAARLRADLKTCRERGYSLDLEEHEPGVICIAVPIVSGSGDLLGGLSMTNHTHLAAVDDLEQQLPRLKQAADDIARQAEYRMLAGSQG